MITIETLKAEIRVLTQELAKNGMMIRMEQRREGGPRTTVLEDLMAGRTEIFKSIIHRQGMIIEILTNEVNFERKVA